MTAGLAWVNASHAIDPLFLGTYAQAGACFDAKLVLTKTTFSWFQCQRASYRVIQDEAEQIVIQVPEQKTCPLRVVRIRRPNPAVLSWDIYAYKNLDGLKQDKPQLVCTYGVGG